MKRLSILISALSLLPFAAPAQGPVTPGASSLFTSSKDVNLIERRTAHKKGDLLRVTVNEVMKGQYNASLNDSRTQSSSTDKISLPIVDVFAGPVLGEILGKQAGTPSRIINGLLGANSTGGKQSDVGTGSSSSDSSFTTTLSVEVKDVDANGNLHVEGHRDIVLNKETQRIVLTGIVRTDDVTPDNTVPSDRIAEASLHAEGKGVVARKARQSLLDKILGWLF